ncbi:MAG TPA: cobalamin-binding protein, partial [Deltaproteobacteria bacterium]|nr:cobalamin-binding protein [Deltaproteobacteria bacterium]
MSDDIIAMLKENVIQGRTTGEDEGVDETVTGPGVVELTQRAIDEHMPPQEIIT